MPKRNHEPNSEYGTWRKHIRSDAVPLEAKGGGLGG